MPFPIFDPINLPPDTTLIDINTVEPQSLRELHQGEALSHWVEETGADLTDFVARDYDPNEGMFVVVNQANFIGVPTAEQIIGVAIILNVEGA